MRPLLHKTAGTLLAALGAVFLVSIFLDLVPGDPIDAILGEQAQEADRAELRAALHLDDPLAMRLWSFARDTARLELRSSVPPFQERVFDTIGRAAPNTALLAGASLLVAILVALPLGVVAAARPGSRLDAAASAFAVLGVAIPRIWLGPLLILVFAIGLDWLPVSGLEEPAGLVLPALTLGLALSAFLARMIRASLLDATGEDYVRTARAKGLSEARVIAKHALRNALLPVLTVLGLQLGALLGGAVITEKVFNYPGMGSLLLQAIDRRDYNMVRACVLAFTLAYVAVNLLTDLAYAAADPRVRRRR
ncbi:ABC transporter permease [Vulgatibacter incomptus]|uniref:Dipeptide transport system permease protein DppB n=1 Tax=Vulgatibacter incomptus TaxID=1391653 RepID=A0A0K1PF72_9BACT|nr:ABC transporter permease [Vulgatibacter incomptus]AKU92157.1 Dipeptide transport system permease protein DppB [Vulgatibacter incomptus]